MTPAKYFCIISVARTPKAADTRIERRRRISDGNYWTNAYLNNHPQATARSDMVASQYGGRRNIEFPHQI